MQKKSGDNSSSRLTAALGARILSEANDLKRTLKALAEEIEIDEIELNRIVKGECSLSDSMGVIEKMGKRYPIDNTDLCLFEDDCENGVKLMRASRSKESNRFFQRKDKSGIRTDYYEYQDTAMAKISPFRPEWIKMLRPVNNNDPLNPDVAYNNGHFLHQMTFFVGPVNFYWEVNGKKYCREMNTGDSNYITPFWAHSFTTRDTSQEAYILAATFGGDVRRAQKELYTLGKRGIENYSLDCRQPRRGVAQLIRQHMINENMTLEVMEARLKNHSINIRSILNSDCQPSLEELEIIAGLLHVEVFDFILPKYNFEEEVAVKQKSESEMYFYPSDRDRKFRINPLARAAKMPLSKGFDITPLADEVPADQYFNSSLHSYVYNYGTETLKVCWRLENQEFSDILHPDDSMVLQPFIPHTFVTTKNRPGNLCVMRVSGAVNLSTQRELSYFARRDRVIETSCWFD